MIAAVRKENKKIPTKDDNDDKDEIKIRLIGTQLLWKNRQNKLKRNETYY